jgi:hypothetical protein
MMRPNFGWIGAVEKIENKKPHEAAGFGRSVLNEKMLSRADLKLSDEGPFGHAAMHELVISGCQLRTATSAARTTNNHQGNQ